MAWILLIVAGLLEVGWAVGLKQTDGFTRLWPSVITMLVMAASFWVLSLAVRTIPLGTGYAVWTGIGAVGVAVVGMALYREPATAARLACIALIVAGIVGLKLTSPGTRSSSGDAASIRPDGELPAAPDVQSERS